MIKTTKSIFFIGIKGAAMSNLAVIFKKMGKTVSGCDTDEEFITDTILHSYHIPNLVGFSENILPKHVDLVVYSAAHNGKDNPIAIEADEYGVNPPLDKTPKLLLLNPTHIICTNIDFDHPDVYKDITETKETFKTFFDHKRLYLCIDDPQIKSVMGSLDKKQHLTYGFSKEADLQIQNPVVNETQSSFNLIYKGAPLGLFTISLFGEKNISNAAGVILSLLDLGLNSEEIKKAIKNFSSVKRRNELIYHQNDIYLFDDYGHHPAEIAATISAARARFKNRRIILLFQPHTFSRTLSLKADFAVSLATSDYCLVAPIFPSAREKKEKFKVTSYDIEKEANKKGVFHVKACDSKEYILNKLDKYLKKKDIVFTVGAGDIYKLHGDIIKIMNRHAQNT